MTFIVVENLRGFFNSRPPLVVFMICLASFAIALITFAYLVRVRDLPNPDVSEDWNSLLSKFSGLEFCVSSDGGSADDVPAHVGNLNGTYDDDSATSGKVKIGQQHPADMLKDIHEHIKPGGIGSKDGVDNTPPTAAPPPKTPASRVTKRDTTQLQAAPSQVSSLSSGTTHGQTSVTSLPHNMTSVILPLNMEVAPNAELLAVSLQTVHLSAIVSGKTLKLNGPGHEHSMLISLSFPRNLSKDDCEEWQGTKCSLYVINTCVTFTGPTSMFPRTQKPDRSSVCEGDVTTVTAESYARNMTAVELIMGSSWCAGGSRLTAEFSFDDALTVLLSQQDRSMINLHLMRTSYFLFVMVITLFCYAMVRGRPAKIKAVHVAYEKVKMAGP